MVVMVSYFRSTMMLYFLTEIIIDNRQGCSRSAGNISFKVIDGLVLKTLQIDMSWTDTPGSTFRLKVKLESGPKDIKLSKLFF